MKYAYPIVITPSDGDYVVYVPDLDINTQGSSVADAMEMARDAIGMWGCFEQDEKRTIPKPGRQVNVKTAPNDIVTLVDVDFDEYRRRNENRAVRKNVTIPSWLNERAEEAGVNFSAVMQDALKARLHLEGR
ncbi:HicB family protein [Candidatus Gastranaerophilales bacterium]|nr:MAG: HicB family protein [Candidatus Gastranaerophilales bacterium]